MEKIKTFYVTTPIYYVNDQPHIGHAYTTVAADVLARYNRIRGRRVFFLTGSDEHGQKIEQAAAAKGISPKQLADEMASNYRELWARLNVTPDAFIRTTDEQHKKIVQDVLSDLWSRGEIEKRSYTGWYCTPDERFWTEKDLVGGNCPDCGRKVERIEEENYFFLMSRYAGRLIEHIESNPGFILPESRRNEVLGFLRSQPLGDLCISRPMHRLSWGIPLPFDPGFVTYVWFDALLNYYSGPMYLAPALDKGEWWPADHHLIGKDILTTHSVYWPAMLMAMGKPLPRNIFAHGWWTIEGRKMSKSLGNVVDPNKVIETYGADAFRYFLMREVPFGLDGDYSEDALIKRINIDLANDLGNLASRVLKMIDNYCGGIIPAPEAEETEMAGIARTIPPAVEEQLSQVQFHRALDEIWKLVSYTNKYIDTNAPWALAKDPAQAGRLGTVLYNSAEALRFLSVNLMPFMPDSMAQLRVSLGLPEAIVNEPEYKWGVLKPGTAVGSNRENLFPRIFKVYTLPLEDRVIARDKVSVIIKEMKVTEPEKTPEATAPVAPPVEGQSTPELIGIEDVVKVELKTAKILEAVRVEKSKKLIRLQVDCGGQRQIVAGIGTAYTPEELVGKTIVIVANLKPAKLMGVESQGMLLAATDEDGLPIILTTEKEVRPGLRVK